MLALLATATFSISGTVPEVCRAVPDGEVWLHQCNRPGPYQVVVTVKRRSRYCGRLLEPGTHVLTFHGPEIRRCRVEAVNG